MFCVFFWEYPFSTFPPPLHTLYLFVNVLCDALTLPLLPVCIGGGRPVETTAKDGRQQQQQQQPQHNNLLFSAPIDFWDPSLIHEPESTSHSTTALPLMTTAAGS
jgi:hypothetical protein